MALTIDPTVGVEVASDAVARAMRAGADAAKAQHGYSEGFEVNFDTNDVTLVRSTVSDDLAITVYVDTCEGTAQLTGRDHDAVDRAVAEALTSARAGQPDPANVLPEDPADPATSSGAEEPDREAMVDAALRHIERVRSEYPSLRTESSQYSFTCAWSSYANCHGRVQHARRGRYGTTLMVTGKDGERATSFNYAAVVGVEPFADLTTLIPIDRLLRETAGSFDAMPVPSTFVGDLIFTPESLDDLVRSVAGALGGMALIRKATPYLDRLGEAIAAPSFSLLHRPGQLASAAPFDGAGFPNRDLDLIRDGVLESFLIGWYASHKLDRPMTSGLSDLVVAPGDDALDDIIASTDRGILLGRFSGGQPNQNLEFSGVAKNSFYVEGGKIVGPITETMIAGNFQSALQQIRAISRETVDTGYSCYPWLATTGVTISTK
jgi:PmbA protein